MASRSFENPLIPHARMRAMYRAMVEVRTLSTLLPRAQRIVRRTEACWVAPAIGLEPQDVVSAPNMALLAHIRHAGERAGAVNRSTLERFQQQTTKPFTGNHSERLFFAAGQASATRNAAIVLAFAAADALNAAEWQRLFATISTSPLPLVLTILPSAKINADLPKLAGKAGGGPLPVIPVEASDPLALYRVAQEAIVRARAGGGAAVLECVASSADPVETLAEQMLTRRINNAAWLAAVESRIRSLLP